MRLIADELMFLIQAVEASHITGKNALMVGKLLEKIKKQFNKQVEKDGNLEKDNNIRKCSST